MPQSEHRTWWCFSPRSPASARENSIFIRLSRITQTVITSLLLVVISEVSAGQAIQATGLRVAWSTLDAGGGAALGPASSWRLSGTLGQHEPQTGALCSTESGSECNAHGYLLQGGFWPGLLEAEAGTGCNGIDGCLFRDRFEPAAVSDALSGRVQPHE
jgi:hypothetical protein